MALEIVWTVRAAQGFDRIVKHLEEQWTEKEVKNFVKEAYDFFELLKEYPRILQMSTERKNVHRGCRMKKITERSFGTTLFLFLVLRMQRFTIPKKDLIKVVVEVPGIMLAC
jgi:plasmid stabilization system protein ParE